MMANTGRATAAMFLVSLSACAAVTNPSYVQLTRDVSGCFDPRISIDDKTPQILIDELDNYINVLRRAGKLQPAMVDLNISSRFSAGVNEWKFGRPVDAPEWMISSEFHAGVSQDCVVDKYFSSRAVVYRSDLAFEWNMSEIERVLVHQCVSAALMCSPKNGGGNEWYKNYPGSIFG